MSAAVALVVVEREDGMATSLTLELLGLARRLAVDGARVVAACLGAGIDDAVAMRLVAGGADDVVLVDHPLLEPYQADAWLPDLVPIAKSRAPTAVLLPHTAMGADLAPRLAFRLGTTVATGCVEARLATGVLQFTRPCYGGNASEVVSFRSAPAVVTIKAKTQGALPRDDARHGNIERRQAVVTGDDVRTRITSRTRAENTSGRLDSANVVVSGGRGIGGPEGFSQARILADLLGGAVGASRVACDLGWCPPSWQVGLSGKTVAPELYFALGISGAGQHMAGCGNARTIVAVNTDANADIFKSARFGIVGDCREILPALIAEIGGKKT